MTQGTATGLDEAYRSEMNHMHVTRLAGSGWFSRALAVAARLGIADLVTEQPMTAEEIAARTGSEPQVMRRLLQMLKVWAVFERDEEGRYSLTEKFAPLREDHPFSMRNYCILMAETYDDAFAGLGETLRTGGSGFRAVFGVSLYEWLERAENAETAAIFDRAMAELSRPVAALLARQRDFSEVRTVVDVGGGGAGMVAGLVAAHPHLHGVCADRASVCERGPQQLAKVRGEDVSARVSFQPADIFTEVPTGGDLYLLKNVLHDWTFDSGVRILTSIAEAMRRTGAASRLLVLEPLVETDFDAVRAMFQRVVCEEGTGFTRADLEKMIEAAGLTVVSVDQLVSNHTVFECELTGE
ncbi:methyltransferase [Micromonospora sp. NPDC049274]|uniref:methyltransferase n=1 Tax=Micromonospora sp. NPDC049274 TaxID=3154829 RepID=UPI00344549D7